jgi:hypothetical protein
MLKYSYGYTPTAWVCGLFIGLFGLSTCESRRRTYFFGLCLQSSSVIHVGQLIRFRMWWLLPTAVLAGIGETIGWSGRRVPIHHRCVTLY